MAQRLAYLEAVIGADVTAFRRGMRDIRNEVGFLSETVSGISGAGRALTFMFTTPLVAMGTAAINVAAAFEASMYNINAIAGLTGQGLDALSQRALEFGANTRSGAQAAADALYTVFSAGLTDPEQAFKAMEVATYTAEAGLADLTVTTEAMLAVMLSYGDTGEEMAWRVSNAMTQMVAVGVGSMQDFSGALGSVVPTAQGLGMSVEELMGDMAFLTQRGLSAARAGTALNSALTALIKPTDAMSAAMTSLGADSSQELIDNFGGVNGALKALIDHAGGSQEALASMFGNIRGLRAINLFAGDVDMWNASMEEFNGALDGATMRAWDSQMMSFSATWDKLKSSVMGAAVVIGTQFFPILQPILSALTALALQVVTMDKGVLKMAVGFVTFAAVLPPVVWLLTSLISPFGIAIGLVTGLGIAFGENFKVIKDSILEATTDASAGIDFLKLSLSGLWDAIKPPKDIDPFENIDFSVLDDTGGSITIGGGGASQSLWDLYEDSGVMETMSWTEFMDAATEGGWDGGVIDAPITIDTGTGISDAVIQTQADIDTIAQSLEGTTPVLTMPFFDRLQSAIDEFAPAIMRSLSWLGSRVIGWFGSFDGAISKAIARFVGFFLNIDTSVIYTAITEILSGDFSSVFDAFGVDPQAVGGFWDSVVTGLQTTFPTVTQGLETQFTALGNWVLTNAIPLLARSFGFLAGRIGVLLSNAVNAGIAYFTGGGAGDVASAIGAYVDESLVTPFSEGMQDTGIGRLITGFGNTLKRAWTTLFTALKTTISSLIMSLFTWLDTEVNQKLNDFVNFFYYMDTNAVLETFTELFSGDFSSIFDAFAVSPEDVRGIWVQVSEALTRAFPTLITGLSQNFVDLGSGIAAIFSAGVDWFDGIGGSILSSMIRGVSGIDTALIYEGIQALFTGDWSWLTAQFTGGGDAIKAAVGGWGAKIEEALPEITAGLSNLMAAIGTFAVDEGIPLLARSFGFLAGRIGVLLSNAVNAGIAYFTGGGAGDVASAIGAYVDESLVTPFSEGMQDATEGTDLAANVWSTLGANITTGMTDGVAGIDIGVVTAALGVKLGEIGTWFADTGLAKISEGVGYMTGRVAILIGEGLAMAIDAVKSFFGGGADTEGSAITFGEDVATPFVTGFATALAEGDVTNPLDGFMTAMVGGLVLLATVNTFLPVVSAIGLALRGATTLYSWTSTGISVVTPMMAAMKTAIVGWSGYTGLMTTIGGGMSTAASAIAAGASWVVSAAGSILGAIGAAITSIPFLLVLGGITLGAAVFMLLSEDFKTQVRDTIGGAINAVLGEGAWEQGMLELNNMLIGVETIEPIPIGYEWVDVTPTEDNPMGTALVPVGSQEIPVGASDEGTTPQSTQPPVMGQFTPTALPTGEAPLEIPTTYVEPPEGTNTIVPEEPVPIPIVPVIALSETQAMFADAIAGGGTMQSIIDEQLIPLETYWNTMFGAEGTMAVSFGEFTTGVTEGWTEADVAANTFLDTLNEGLPTAQTNLMTFSSALTTSMNAVTTTLLEAANAASSVVDKIVELVALDTSVSVDVSVSSEGTDGSHADGLANVPYDGYISELHKGERVLTAQENKRYNEDGNIRVPQNALRGNSGNGGGDTYQTNQITITGVSDFDSFVKEAKRRGIKLG